MNFLLIILWIITTLVIISFSAVIAKKHGVEYMIAINAVLVVLANIFASKIIVVGPFTAPAGILVFSMTFLITDILSEKWGKEVARKAVWAGFYANVVMIFSVYIALSWEPAPFAADFAIKFGEVLWLTPRIAIASMLTYLISQHHDVWAFHFWKRKTKGKHLWFRNNASTIVSQLIDSVIFIFIAFSGTFTLEVIFGLILGQWLLKVLIAVLDTPFMYFMVRYLK